MPANASMRPSWPPPITPIVVIGLLVMRREDPDCRVQTGFVRRGIVSVFLQYQDIYAPALRGEHNNRYKDKFVAFRTLLETID